MSLPVDEGGSFNRTSCLVVSGLIGSIQAFGPPTLPMWPTLLNFQRPFCHCAMSVAREAASPAFAVRQRAQIGSRRRDESLEVRTSRRAERYLGLSCRVSASLSRSSFSPDCPLAPALSPGGGEGEDSARA